MIIPLGNEIKEEEKWYKIESSIISNINDYYLISNWGRIYNSFTKNYLPKNINYDKDKYITISLSLKNNTSIFVQPHRLLLIMLNPIIGYEKLDVNHKDGIKYHNWIWNLEWNTRSENIQHALKNNLFNLGETRNNSKLSNNEARKICELISDNKDTKFIVDTINRPDLNVPKIIQNIKLGHSWKHISCEYDFSNCKK